MNSAPDKINHDGSINPDYVTYLESRIHFLSGHRTEKGVSLILPSGVRLTPRQSEALMALVAHNGTATQQMLFDDLYQDRDKQPTQQSVNVLMSKLRQRLAGWVVIETTYGQGYQLAPEFVAMLTGKRTWRKLC